MLALRAWSERAARCSTRTCAGATRPRGRAAHTASTSRSSRAGRATQRAWSREDVGPQRVRRYVASLSEPDAAPSTTARKLAALRALFSSQREHGLIAQNPADLVSHAAALLAPAARAEAQREAARLLDAIRRRPRGPLALSCATARCSSSPTRAGCAPRSSCRSTVADVDHDGEQLRVEGKGRKTRFVPVGEVALAAREALPGARPRPARARRRPAAREATGAVPRARPAGRSARATCAGGSADAGRRRARESPAPDATPARAAAQLRDPPARRWRGPAQHPGAARARERLHHPDLHSGRVRQAEKRLCAQPPSGLNRGGEDPGDECQSDRAAGTLAAVQDRRRSRVPASGWWSPTRRWSST